MTTVEDVKKTNITTLDMTKHKFDEILQALKIMPPGKKIYVNGASKDLAQICINIKDELVKKV